MEGSLRRRLVGYAMGFGALFLLVAMAVVFFTDRRDRLGPETPWLLGAAALVAFFFAKASRRAFRPLERLADAAERMAAGATVEIPGEDRDDEIGQIAGSLVWLRHNNEKLLQQRQEEYATILAVLETMADGIALVDGDGRIRFANQAFGDVASMRQELLGRRLDEVLRAPGVIEAVISTGRGSEPQVVGHSEPGIAGRRFEVRVAAVAAPGALTRGVLVVFHDVTRIESLERVRREFVANVSHELRTPLTSIKGAVETLLDTELSLDVEMRSRLLVIARRQAQRMEALVADLTDLSQIETGAIRLDRQEVDLSVVVSDLVQQFARQAEERYVSFETKIPPSLMVHADRRRLEQILVNLIDNGLKFNRPGGLIKFEAQRGPNGVTLRVTDTGIGIPSDAAQDVFHRFFRVDASRAGETPGTGLGLSIVKHLMRLHGGSVDLDSELGKGSTFTLYFPD